MLHAPFWQGLAKHSFSSSLHVLPPQPAMQEQEKLPGSSVQEPLLQGLVAHSRTSSAQVGPCQPGAQVQVKLSP